MFIELRLNFVLLPKEQQSRKSMRYNDFRFCSTKGIAFTSETIFLIFALKGILTFLFSTVNFFSFEINYFLTNIKKITHTNILMKLFPILSKKSLQMYKYINKQMNKERNESNQTVRFPSYDLLNNPPRRFPRSSERPNCSSSCCSAQCTLNPD